VNTHAVLRRSPDLRVSNVGEDYLLELVNADVYCVVNQEAYSIVMAIDGLL